METVLNRTETRKLTVTGLMIALGMVLPILTHLAGLPGNMLLPMHLPVLLAGMLCGTPYGAISGALLPIISCVLTGKPQMFPMVPLMVIELTSYGFVAGYLYQKKRENVYMSLLVSMVIGRFMYALGLFLMGAMFHLEVPAVISIVTSFATGLPGAAVQIILIPILVKVAEHFGS